MRASPAEVPAVRGPDDTSREKAGSAELERTKFREGLSLDTALVDCVRGFIRQFTARVTVVVHHLWGVYLYLYTSS